MIRVLGFESRKGRGPYPLHHCVCSDTAVNLSAEWPEREADLTHVYPMLTALHALHMIPRHDAQTGITLSYNYLRSHHKQYFTCSSSVLLNLILLSCHRIMVTIQHSNQAVITQTTVVHN